MHQSIILSDTSNGNGKHQFLKGLFSCIVKKNLKCEIYLCWIMKSFIKEAQKETGNMRLSMLGSNVNLMASIFNI